MRDRPTVGKKVYIQSDRLLCALCSSWHCFSVLLFTLNEKKNNHFISLSSFISLPVDETDRKKCSFIKMENYEKKENSAKIVSEINPFLFNILLISSRFDAF